MKILPVSVDIVQEHFTKRAPTYNQSSRWCTDNQIINLLLQTCKPTRSDVMLDVAVGTGLVAKHFKGKVKKIVGSDINTDMANQSADFLDEFVQAPAENLPFKDDTFDIITCRQGIQFMDIHTALKEMVRVLKPKGRICLLDLCAYSKDDMEEYFEILRLRNPARRNFFLLGDVATILEKTGKITTSTIEYITTEDVEIWSDNGAIDKERREAIRRIYLNASEPFKALHSVQLSDGRIVDNMLFTLTYGLKS